MRPNRATIEVWRRQMEAVAIKLLDQGFSGHDVRWGLMTGDDAPDDWMTAATRDAVEAVLSGRGAAPKELN